jgi:hypothetical protein
VRKVRVSSLLSRYNSRKVQPFDIHHFDIGFCRPIPSNANLKKERPVCISFMLEGHGDSLRKTYHTTAERLGEKGTCFIIIKQVQYPQGLRGEGDKKIV